MEAMTLSLVSSICVLLGPFVAVNHLPDSDLSQSIHRPASFAEMELASHMSKAGKMPAVRKRYQGRRQSETETNLHYEYKSRKRNKDVPGGFRHAHNEHAAIKSSILS
jgi:hypothetical protein